MQTPAKDSNTSLLQTLTPVRFLDSPRQKQTTDSNLIICKERLEKIIKNLQDNYDKWKLAHQRGLALCTNIEAIKTRNLEKSNTNEEPTIYPSELTVYCTKLATIAGIFDDIVKSTQECLRQLNALSKLPNSCNEIFYRSWKLPQFIEFVENLLECYEPEAVVKQNVMRELPHCTTRAELVHCSSAWEYPQYADSWLVVLFAFLLQEITTEKKK